MLFVSSSNLRAHPGGYRPDIDGLRALAIIAVVTFHAKMPFFSGGYIGVDVFFVISGYLIASLVYRDICESRFSFARFYLRRAKRILPALLTVILVCDIIAFLFLSPLELRDYCAQAFSAVASSSNIYYWLRSNYFNPVTAYKPLLMTWSLGIEEQFYLLFPLSLVLLHKFMRQQLIYWIGAACIASFVCCEMLLNAFPSAAFYLLPTRAWELGVGVFLAIYELQHNLPLQPAAWAKNALGWIGLTLVLLPISVYSEATRFPGWTALVPTIGTAFLIVARESFVNRKLLGSRPVVLIGLISYSWYLWHWPLMSFARIVSGGLLSVRRATLIVVVSFGLAAISHWAIEQPFRQSRTPTRHLLPAYAAALLIFAVPPLVGYLQAGWPNRMPQLVQAEASVGAVERNVCLAAFNQDKPRLTSPCITGPDGPRIALLGDSHAAALAPGLRELAQQHGYGFELLSKASCPPLAEVTLRWVLYPSFERSCATFNHAVFDHVANDPQISTVVVAGFWSAPLSPDARQLYVSLNGGEQSGSRAENEANLRSGILNAIERLQAAKKRVVVAVDVPRFAVDPMSSVRNVIISRRGELAQALSSYRFTLAAVPEEALIKATDTVADNVVRQAVLEAGAQVLEMNRNLCPAGLCRFWRDGVLFYSDVSHLTAAGSKLALHGQDSLLLENIEPQSQTGSELNSLGAKNAGGAAK